METQATEGAPQSFQFSIMNCLLIAAIAILTSSLSEIISWFLLYRKD